MQSIPFLVKTSVLHNFTCKDYNILQVPSISTVFVKFILDVLFVNQHIARSLWAIFLKKKSTIIISFLPSFLWMFLLIFVQKVDKQFPHHQFLLFFPLVFNKSGISCQPCSQLGGFKDIIRTSKKDQTLQFLSMCVYLSSI